MQGSLDQFDYILNLGAERTLKVGKNNLIRDLGEKVNYVPRNRKLMDYFWIIGFRAKDMISIEFTQSLKTLKQLII